VKPVLTVTSRRDPNSLGFRVVSPKKHIENAGRIPDRPGSRVELVGAINRMDRQFSKDPTVGLTHAQLGCGEISLIYRFS